MAKKSVKKGAVPKSSVYKKSVKENAVESLNSVIRKAIRNRKIFPNEQSAMKVIYLAILKASERWTRPLQNWKPAMNIFAIKYAERFDAEI